MVSSELSNCVLITKNYWITMLIALQYKLIEFNLQSTKAP